MSARRWLALWGPVLGLVLLLFWLSSRPTLPGSELLWDKLAHGVAYAVFGLLALRAFHGGLTAVRPRAVGAALVLTLAYGAFDEWHQAHVPGRYASLQDWIADAVGGVLAVPLFVLLGSVGVKPAQAAPPAARGPVAARWREEDR